MESNKKIYITKDYEQFKTLVGNRAVDGKRINKIMDSIKNVGYITNPIIVNEKMEVIDGQGRLEVFKRLDMPVEYIIQNSAGVTECISMNINQTNWKHIDYIKSYADAGNQNYKYILDLIQKFPMFSVLTIESAVFNVSKIEVKLVINGKLQCSEEQYLKAYDKLQYLLNFDFLKTTVKGKIHYFQTAIMFCYETEEVDNQKLLEKMQSYGYLLGGFVNIVNCIDEIEKVYNRNTRSDYVYIGNIYRKNLRENCKRTYMSHKELYEN